MREKNFVSLVVYLRNVEDTIQQFLTNVDRLMGDKFEAYEFVLVNDNSQDDTVKRIKEVSDKIKGNITLIELAWKHNLELAMLAGVDMAIGDFVYEIESTDMDYDVDLLWEIYQKAMTGYDIVAATPDKPLKLTSKLFYKYLNKVSYRNLELTTERIRLVSRRALNRILRSKEKIRYRKALYKYAGFESTTIKYQTIDKTTKTTDDTLYDKFGLATDVLIGFSNIGTRISLTLSLIFLAFSVLVGVYAIHIFLTKPDVEAGWTSIMLFLSMSFTGMFFILAFLSKYMTTIIVELKDRPNYTYKSVSKLSKK